MLKLMAKPRPNSAPTQNPDMRLPCWGYACPFVTTSEERAGAYPGNTFGVLISRRTQDFPIAPATGGCVYRFPTSGRAQPSVAYIAIARLHRACSLRIADW